MKNILIIFCMATLALMLVGCNSLEEKKAEGIINKYYQALVDEDYEEAFKQLQLYDYNALTGEGHYTEGTTLTVEEAKAIYLEKIAFLKEQSYKVTDFEIVEVEYEDGHSFWHHIKLGVEQGDEKFELREVAEIYNGKLVIGEKDDRNGRYRDGRIGFEVEGIAE